MPTDTATERPFRGQDLTGKVFGKITVIGFDGFYRSPARPQSRNATWECKCECGKTTRVSSGNLTSGTTQSCGCFKLEIHRKRLTKHGHKRSSGTIHPLYNRWNGMVARCDNPKHSSYRIYGGKGVTVCARWRNFAEWLKDMEAGFKPGLTIDRKDGSKNYSCGKCDECFKNEWEANCCWSTMKQQASNTKRNVWIEHEGNRLTVTQWSELLGISQAVIYYRVKAGKSATDCLMSSLLKTPKP